MHILPVGWADSVTAWVSAHPGAGVTRVGRNGCSATGGACSVR